MKFSILALSTVLALAVADTTTAGASSTTTTPEVECAKQCDARDICCTAKCYNVPCPSDGQADDTNSCVSACPQGTGSPADTQKYSDCEQSCYSSHFWGGNGGATATHSTSTGTSTGTFGTTATQTGSSSSTTDSSDSSNSSSDSNDSSNSDSSDATATSSSGFSQQTTNSAAHVKLGASAAGLFGLVVAAFAL